MLQLPHVAEPWDAHYLLNYGDVFDTVLSRCSRTEPGSTRWIHQATHVHRHQRLLHAHGLDGACVHHRVGDDLLGVLQVRVPAEAGPPVAR